MQPVHVPGEETTAAREQLCGVLLPPVKHATYESLARELRGGAVESRRQSARILGTYGARAVEPLCAALEDQDAEVRIAAAEALGLLGDERAVRPLGEALRGSLVGRSARRQLAVGVMVVLAVCLFAIVWFWGLKIGGSVWLFITVLKHTARPYFRGRQAQSRVTRAITEALMRIAERNPTPELHAVVPELKAIAVDTLQHEKATRVVSRDAAHRIESLTEKLKSMPLPAAPAVAADQLPLPAASPTPQSGSLPRPTE
jgi:hypothetical protein